MGKTWRMKQRAGCLVQVRRLPTDTKCSETNALGIGTNCTVMHCIALHCITLHCTSQNPQTAVLPKSRELCTLVQCYVDLWTLCALQWQSVCSSIVQLCGSTEVRSSRASRRPFPAPGRLSCYPSISTRHLLVPQLSIFIHTKSLSISVNMRQFVEEIL